MGWEGVGCVSMFSCGKAWREAGRRAALEAGHCWV